MYIQFLDCSNHRVSTYTRGALGCTVPPVWLELPEFVIGNLSYTPCREPSRTVLMLDVMYTMNAATRLNTKHPPFTAPYYNSSMIQITSDAEP